jgi:uncharacterized membrane protein
MLHPNRPKIKLERQLFDVILDRKNWALLTAFWIYILFSYNSLPESIPTHYNFKGEIDAYGSKKMLWMLPIIATIITVGFHFLVKVPHIFNYIVSITEKNAKKQYLLANRMLRVLRLFITIIFFSLSFTTTTLNVFWLVPVLISALFLSIGIYIYLSLKHE